MQGDEGEAEIVGGKRRLRFRRADEADREAEHERGFRRARRDELEQAEQRGRRIADRRRRAAKTRRAKSSMPAAERVWPERAASSARAGLLDRDVDRVCRPAARRGDCPAATMRTSQRIGAPPASAARPCAPAPAEKARSATTSGMPQACTMRAATGRMSAGSAARFASAAMISKERRVISAGSRM